MKFFFPDSQDQVDPSFNFETERRSEMRMRHRDDHYAHEEFDEVPFDGLLVSKAMVEGGRYTLPQKHRLMREGVRRFFRLGSLPIETMGDCGAFSYVREEAPPYSVDEVLRFYDELGVDFGISVDHVILGFNANLREEEVPTDWKRRQEITLQLAAEFLREHSARGSHFVPLGVAQGWSPSSYALAVQELQKMGYSYIALGGMVPLKTPEILACLEAIAPVRTAGTKLHLLGITRCERVRDFERYGAASFDSTSPLRQAFKDLEDNYYTLDRTYSAIRVPQVQANPSLSRRILAGKIDQVLALRLEKRCLEILAKFELRKVSTSEVVETLVEYESLYDPGRTRKEAYEEALTDTPWRTCPCNICQRIGIHVILFRGAERNRRRGFHNIFIFHKRLQRHLARDGSVQECALAGGTNVR